MCVEQLGSRLPRMRSRTFTPTSEPSRVDEPFDAVLFDLDGVLTSTTALHAACWKSALDEVLAEWRRRTGTEQRPFDAGREYIALVDGKPRHDGVRAFLGARGIAAPEGSADSPAGEWSVHGIGNRKQALVEQALARDGVTAFGGSVRWVRRLRADGVRTAVVSSSANSRAVLRAAGLGGLFDVIVDGRDAERLGLRGKPAPDGFLTAAARLSVDPCDAVVVEDAIAGVAAGRAGGFGLVVGVARNAAPDDLRLAGADLVVADLEEML
jgi:alpha,alpha-trehalose phosphorylase